MENITSCLRALQALLDVSWPRAKIGNDQVRTQLDLNQDQDPGQNTNLIPGNTFYRNLNQNLVEFFH